jgi:hypothetical protein
MNKKALMEKSEKICQGFVELLELFPDSKHLKLLCDSSLLLTSFVAYEMDDLEDTLLCKDNKND